MVTEEALLRIRTATLVACGCLHQWSRRKVVMTDDTVKSRGMGSACVTVRYCCDAFASVAVCEIEPECDAYYASAEVSIDAQGNIGAWNGGNYVLPCMAAIGVTW